MLADTIVGMTDASVRRRGSDSVHPQLGAIQSARMVNARQLRVARRHSQAGASGPRVGSDASRWWRRVHALDAAE